MTFPFSAIVGHDQLRLALKAQVRRKLHRVFFLNDGGFAFEPGDHAQGMFRGESLKVQPVRAIYQGVRSAWNADRLKAALFLLEENAIKCSLDDAAMARYGLGDQDPGAPGRDFVIRTTVDVAGTNLLSAVGAPRYSADVAPIAALSSASQLCGTFNGSGQYLKGATVSTSFSEPLPSTNGRAICGGTRSAMRLRGCRPRLWTRASSSLARR